MEGKWTLGVLIGLPIAGLLVLAEPWHGTNGYSNRRCRCAICRAAWTAWCRGARLRRRELITADPSIRPHGVESTYLNYMCRCRACVAEHSRRQYERNQRRMAVENGKRCECVEAY